MYGTTGYDIVKEIAKITAPHEGLDELYRPPRKPFAAIRRVLNQFTHQGSVLASKSAPLAAPCSERTPPPLREYGEGIGG